MDDSALNVSSENLSVYPINRSNLCQHSGNSNMCWHQYENGTWVNFTNRVAFEKDEDRRYVEDYCARSPDACYCPNGTIVMAWAGVACVGGSNQPKIPDCYDDINKLAVYNDSSDTYYCVSECPSGYEDASGYHVTEQINFPRCVRTTHVI